METLAKYLKWRPLLTTDGFWIGVLKMVPYEITSAYILIRSAYEVANDADRTGWLLFAVAALTIFVFVLHRSVAKATWTSALALAVVFFLLALFVDAQPTFHDWFVDATALNFTPVSYALDALIRRFPILIIAVIIVLGSSSLRTILGKAPEQPETKP